MKRCSTQRVSAVTVDIQSLSRVRLFVTPWTVALQASLPMEFPRPSILEWVAIPFSKGSSQLRDQTQVSCLAGRMSTTEPPITTTVIVVRSLSCVRL